MHDRENAVDVQGKAAEGTEDADRDDHDLAEGREAGAEAGVGVVRIVRPKAEADVAVRGDDLEEDGELALQPRRDVPSPTGRAYQVPREPEQDQVPRSDAVREAHCDAEKMIHHRAGAGGQARRVGNPLVRIRDHEEYPCIHQVILLPPAARLDPLP
eukprot:scaffold1282_cov251-Pinguiococcus_pyrenoidosus.AAC.80